MGGDLIGMSFRRGGDVGAYVTCVVAPGTDLIPGVRALGYRWGLCQVMVFNR